MKLLRRSTTRSGFTLIELLVVIAIIAVLAALIMAGVMRWLGVQPEKQAIREILDLSAAVEKFKARFTIYPPSKFFLAPTRAGYNLADPLHKQSLETLDKMFPKLAETW